MNIKGTYSVSKSTNAMGVEHTFCGPGMSRYLGVNFQQPNNPWATSRVGESDADSDAERVALMLCRAYEAGRKSMAADLRELLGVHT